MKAARRLTVVLFDGFELLDAFGPLELFGAVPEQFESMLTGPAAGAVRSAQGPEVLVERAYSDVDDPGIVLVPGGIGTRHLVSDAGFLRSLRDMAARAETVASVCTGSALLAAAGLLDGYRATSNKRAFTWVRDQGPRVRWIPAARWVEDGNRWTSSGVAAGMDMALAIIAHHHGEALAQAVADRVELEWHRDTAWDPYAVLNGLGSAR